MRRSSSLVLASSFLVLGFLLVTAVTSVDESRRATEPRRKQLVELIEKRQDLVAAQDEAVRVLRADVADAQRQANRRSRLDREAGQRAAALAMEAGTVAVRGEGLVVRLSDSDRRAGPSGDDGAYRIHDADLQLVVNALFAAGAEAVAVNDNRLVATSAIRSAGDTIVVNFRPLGPPYSVTAIGADRDAFEDSQVAGRFRQWTRLFGLGFSVSQRDVTVPAFSGRVAISSARPAGAS